MKIASDPVRPDFFRLGRKSLSALIKAKTLGLLLPDAPGVFGKIGEHKLFGPANVAHFKVCADNIWEVFANPFAHGAR